MKLLLTSAGFTNNSIRNELARLVGKRFEDASICYIPTASNVEIGSKEWQIEDLKNIEQLKFKALHITDISAVPEKIWLPQIESADVLFFEGGDTRYLMEWINKSGLHARLPVLLNKKIYVGVSAGSMVVAPEVNIDIEHVVYESYLDEKEHIPMLGLVDFYVIPHLNSRWFKNVTEPFIRKMVHTDNKLYVLDDSSAVSVDGKTVSIISEGNYFEMN
jgi:dipeptidase E